MGNNAELNDLIERYKKIDLSAESENKEKILERLLLQFENAEDNSKDRLITKKAIKPIYALVAVLSLLLAFSAVVYGQDAIRFVREMFIGDHAYFSSEIDRGAVDYNIPEEFAGKVFDKEGNQLDEYPHDFEDYIELYNEAGEKIVPYQDKSGDVLLTEEEFKQKTQERRKNMTTAFETLEEAEVYFISDEYMMPAYLPKGYEFARAEIYNNDDGVPEANTKYMDVYYSNGTAKIDMSLRFMDEETAFEFGGLGELTKIDINGYSAVKIGNSMLSVEIDGIMYTFNRNDDADVSTEDLVSMDEIILMAESLTLRK